MQSRRYLSSTVNENLDAYEPTHDLAHVLQETTVDALASKVPVLEEISLASGDSYFPVAALQYVIGHVHSYTGLNWWASIALTTLLIRLATVPLVINQHKASSKLTLMRPRLEEIRKQMQDAGVDWKTKSEGRERIKALFREYDVTLFTPVKGILIQGPLFLCFYMAISEMVVKVPSFKNGGAFWFTDLTTPDPSYSLPALTGLTFLITVECNAQEGLGGNPDAIKMKYLFRIIAVATIFLTGSFPKAIFFYWITSNLFSLIFGLLMKQPGVRTILGIPLLPELAESSPLFSPLHDRGAAASELACPLPQSEPLRSQQPNKGLSTSLLNQRIRTLEKQLRGTKKNKKK